MTPIEYICILIGAPMIFFSALITVLCLVAYVVDGTDPPEGLILKTMLYVMGSYLLGALWIGAAIL